jgi:hypothetical protein
MAYKARLVTTISGPVDRRLRMFALLKRRRLSDVLTDLLNQNLPQVDELSRQLQESEVASS